MTTYYGPASLTQAIACVVHHRNILTAICFDDNASQDVFSSALSNLEAAQRVVSTMQDMRLWHT